VVPQILAGQRFDASLEAFLDVYGNHFRIAHQQVKDVRLTAALRTGKPSISRWTPFAAALTAWPTSAYSKARGGRLMARLKSEIQSHVLCCQSTLIVDLNLGRVVGHKEPERTDKRLSEARIVAEQAAREAFPAVGGRRKTRGDALSKRFEEALNQARQSR
jgi:hypothetical protein